MSTDVCDNPMPISDDTQIGDVVDFNVKATGEIKHGRVIKAYVDGGYSIQCEDSGALYDSVYKSDIVKVYK